MMPAVLLPFFWPWEGQACGPALAPVRKGQIHEEDAEEAPAPSRDFSSPRIGPGRGRHPGLLRPAGLYRAREQHLRAGAAHLLLYDGTGDRELSRTDTARSTLVAGRAV